MLHPGFATGNAIGLKQAHLRPAKTKAKADNVVDLFGCGYIVMHQPKRLAPDGFEQAVPDMGVDFLADADRFQPGLALDFCGAVKRGLCIRGGAHDLDQRN